MRISVDASATSDGSARPATTDYQLFVSVKPPVTLELFEPREALGHDGRGMERGPGGMADEMDVFEAAAAKFAGSGWGTDS